MSVESRGDDNAATPVSLLGRITHISSAFGLALALGFGTRIVTFVAAAAIAAAFMTGGDSALTMIARACGCAGDDELRREFMGADLAAANVNRSYQLAASSIAIFTFLLFFLYPRFASGEVDALRFQATLIVMGVATFSFAFASFYYYGASLGGWTDDADRTRYSRRGDRLWLLGCVLLFLAPSLILFTVRLLAVASAWFALWLVYLLFVLRYFPRVQTRGKD